MMAPREAGWNGAGDGDGGDNGGGRPMETVRTRGEEW